VDAVDIDPAAVESTLANAQANGVTVHAGLPELAQGEYPLVLANILATPLKLLAPLLCGHVRAGAPGAGRHPGAAGRGTAGGLCPWLPLQVLDSEDGWILMGAARA
jgi:ribosomal protein L11 methyltransferase